ncbi:MAG: helix-turn-helix transcriptional regulator [Firmicutes bacterium]|nr:helix-turn-helix transcriptional regulator [Bacillota bacterium]
MRIIEAVAKRLLSLLEEKQMTQYALCKKVALDPSNIYNICYGRCKTMTIDKLYLIAEGLDMTLQEFLDNPLFDKDNLVVD